MRKAGFVLILVAILGAAVWSTLSQTSMPIKRASRISTDPTSQPAASSLPYTANFLIFTNGTKRIFTDSRYHNLSPDVYINPEKPNSVVVNTEDITWGDFFATLPMKLTKDCLTTGTGQNFCSDETAQLMFYVNGSSDPDVLEKNIKPGDHLLVSYGQAEAVTDQLSQLNEIED